jgi:hypothetical protein
MTIINACAPAEGKHELTKDQFHYELEQHYDIPENDIKIIVEDVNAHIGKEDADQGTTGVHSLHKETNDNGQQVIDFAASKNMTFGSTFFPHKEIYKQTRISPNGMTSYQIDHILIERRWSTNIMNIRPYRCACYVSDHFLVTAIYNSVECVSDVNTVAKEVIRTSIKSTC